MMEKLVSFCMITYNQENFITDAINGAFSQTYGNLEIIISDDCSTDRTFDIAKKMVAEYKGPHKVTLNQNKPNLGIREHVNKLIYELSTGDYILLAAGDDVSVPERSSMYVDYFEKFPQVMSISCKSIEVDENLKPLDLDNEVWDNTYSIYNLNDYFSYKDFFLYSGDSRGLRRDVINSFPPLRFPKAEDIYLFIRSILIGSGCIIRTPLVKRRHHASNVSSKYSTNEMIALAEKQFYTDLEHALRNRYINEIQYKLMKRKLTYLIDYERLYWRNPFKNFKSLFYRALRKLFKVSLL